MAEEDDEITPVPNNPNTSTVGASSSNAVGASSSNAVGGESTLDDRHRYPSPARVTEDSSTGSRYPPVGGDEIYRRELLMTLTSDFRQWMSAKDGAYKQVMITDKVGRRFVIKCELGKIYDPNDADRNDAAPGRSWQR